MSVTTYEVTVENGQIQLPEHIQLPENAKIYIVVPNVKTPKVAHVNTPHPVQPQQQVNFTQEILDDFPDEVARI
jgi:hypothetical protein